MTLILKVNFSTNQYKLPIIEFRKHFMINLLETKVAKNSVAVILVQKLSFYDISGRF